MKKVTVVLDTPEWDVHFGTSLEILQNEIEAGSEVSVLVCDNDLTACESNYDHNLEQCMACISRRNHALALIDGKFKIYRLSDFYKNISLRSALHMVDHLERDPKKLRDFMIDNFEIGESVLSSISSRYAREWPSFEEYGDLLRRFFFSCYVVFEGTKHFLRQVPTDEIVFFNGRMAIQRALMRAIEFEKASYVIHERGRNKDYYKLYKNFSPHSFHHIDAEIREAWEMADPSIREQIAENWYLALSKGVPQTFVSFVSALTQFEMPPEWDSSKENIVIFTSAEFESNFLGKEWAHPIYQNQADGVRRMVQAFEGDSNVHFWVRIHPSLRHKTWETQPLMNISQHNVTIVPAESPLNSYSLLKSSDKVVVFASTIGIEAAFWGKPVVTAGRAQYEDLGSTYTARTHEQLVSLLKSPLATLPKLGTLQYAYYYAKLGEPFRHYQATDLFAGKFKGQPFYESIKTDRVRKFGIVSPKLKKVMDWIFRVFTYQKLKKLLSS